MKGFTLKLAVAVALMVLAALGLALLPGARRQAQLRRDARAVDAYRQAVDAMDSLESGTQLAQVRQYNEALGAVRLADAFAPDADIAPDAEYENLLNPCGNGVMAVLEIPKLGATLPVYHGVDAAAMERTVGHVPGAGLPSGGDGAACVLVAERGTSAARLFEDLDRLIPGDCFTLQAMRETLAYQVERTAVVDAGELKDVALDGDMCALMTRVPGDDSQRLLVLARRLPLRAVPLQDDTRPVPEGTARLVYAIPALLAGLALLAVAETLRRAIARHRLKRMKL